MDVKIIIGQMLMLFSMMLIGYVIWKRNWMDENAYQKLSRIVVNIFNPLLVVYGVAGKSSAGNAGLLLQNLGFVILYYMLLWGMGYVILVILRPVKEEQKLYRLMTMFSNCGFMGIPVITSVFGNDSMIYIVFYMLGFNLLIYTYGINLARKAGEDVHPGSSEKTGTAEPAGAEKKSGLQWKCMLNAGVIASLAAILIFIFQIPLPDIVVDFCDYLGNATIPLSMIMIGISIAKVNLKVIFTNVRIYLFTAVRMVIFPILVTLLVKRFITADPVIFGVFVLQLSMPVASIATLIAKENGADEACCTNGIVLSTLLSIVTIPVVCMFL